MMMKGHKVELSWGYCCTTTPGGVAAGMRSASLSLGRWLLSNTSIGFAGVLVASDPAGLLVT